MGISLSAQCVTFSAETERGSAVAARPFRLPKLVAGRSCSPAAANPGPIAQPPLRPGNGDDLSVRAPLPESGQVYPHRSRALRTQWGADDKNTLEMQPGFLQ